MLGTCSWALPGLRYRFVIEEPDFLELALLHALRGAAIRYKQNNCSLPLGLTSF